MEGCIKYTGDAYNSGVPICGPMFVFLHTVVFVHDSAFESKIMSPGSMFHTPEQ